MEDICSFSSLDTSGCHKIKGSIPGGSGGLGSMGSFSIVLWMLKILFIATSTGREEPHGTNLFRAQSLRISSSLWSLYPFRHGGLNGFLATAAPSDTERSRGINGCLFTVRLPLFDKKI